MGSNLLVQQILPVLAPTFASVDVRCLSFQIDGTRQNVVTVIGFDEKSSVAMTKHIENLLEAHSDFGDDRLRFHFKVESFEGVHDLSAQLQAGSLVFGADRVELIRSVDLPGLKGYIDTMDFLRRRTDWPVFVAHGYWNANTANQNEAALARKLSFIQQDEDLNRNLNAKGFRSIKDVFEVFLDARPNGTPSYSSDIYVAIPVFAAIRDIRYITAKSQLTVSYSCHPALQQDVRPYGSKDLRGEDKRFAIATPECLNNGSCSASAILDIDERSARVNVWIAHSSLGHIHQSSATPRELITVEELNPLWHLLQAFCPMSTFTSQLTRPAKPKIDRNREQREFEQYVGWLLSLHGYAVLVLGDHEKLRAPDSKMEQGSLDILAFHFKRRRALLANCSTTPIEEKDYGKLINLREELLSRVKSERLQTDLAMFSSAAVCVRPPQYDSYGSYVAVFASRDLKKAIENLGDGQEDEFFEELEGVRHGLDTRLIDEY